MITSSRRRWIIAGMLAAVAGVALLSRGTPAPSSARSVSPAETSRRAAPAPAAHARAPGPFAQARVERILRDYEAQAVYPPSSRPFDDGTAYKLAWNTPSAPAVPALGDGQLQIRFASDRAHVLPGEALTSWIEVFRPGAPGELVAVTGIEAWVTTTSGEAVGRVAPLAFRDDGGHRYTSTFRPGDLPRLAERAEAVRLVALVEVGGHVTQVFRDFTFSPRQPVQVRAVRDAMVDGSIVATLDIDLLEEGLVTFEGNLVAADGTPVAWVDTGAELTPGRHAVALTFFGKAVRDAGAPGPYTLRDLRGVFRSPDEDEMPLRWAWNGTHTTAPYALAELSPAIWDAPEKRDRIAALAALAADAPAAPGADEPARVVVIDADGVARELPAK